MAQLRRGGTSGKLLDSKWGAAGGMQRTLPRFNQLQNPGESIYTASLRSRVHTASPDSTLGASAHKTTSGRYHALHS